jgi:hypothetical protein
LNRPIPTPVELTNALETFQDMTGVMESGRIDENTLGQMRQSRCGNEDVSRMGEKRTRRKRFGLFAGKSRRQQLKNGIFPLFQLILADGREKRIKEGN